MIPFSGETPEAMAKAMAKGRATMPTINPESMSFVMVSLEMPSFKRENNLGINSLSILESNGSQGYSVRLSRYITFYDSNNRG